jgi:hypothetical protein
MGRDGSASYKLIDSGETSKMRAINTTAEAIATQAGVAQLGDQLFVRGGRATEVKTVVDGMPVSDSFAGSSGTGTLDIALTSQEGINLITGGFDAEYGNAQSGIVEIATKEGGDRYEGQLKFLTDDFGAPDRTYFNYDNIAFGLGGPVPFAGDAWSFYASGEGVFQDTYLKTLEQRPARRLYFNDTQIASFRDRQEHAMRGQAKLTYRLPGAKKLSAEYLFSTTNNDWYHHSFSRVGYWSEAEQQWWFMPLPDRPDGTSSYTYYNGPAHVSARKSENDQYKMVYTHPLSNDSYLKFRGSLFRTVYNEKVGGKRPEQYVSFTGNDQERDPANLFYAITGDYPIWEERQSDQWTLRGDYQNKLKGGTHELKSGFTLDYYDLNKDSRQYPTEARPFGNFPNIYTENAFGGMMYVQDRLRYKRSMVLNAGLRFDFFDPGVDAVRVSNQRVLALQKPTSGLSFLERWKAQISPRVGMSYPISDKDVLHFHYGRFFQLPDLEFLYDFANNATAGNQLVGNAFLTPKRRSPSVRRAAPAVGSVVRRRHGVLQGHFRSHRHRAAGGGEHEQNAFASTLREQGLRLRPRIRAEHRQELRGLLAGRSLVHAVARHRILLEREPGRGRRGRGPGPRADQGSAARLGSHARVPHVPVLLGSGRLGAQLRLRRRDRRAHHAEAPRSAHDQGRGHQHDSAALLHGPQRAREQAVVALRTGVPALPRGTQRARSQERARRSPGPLPDADSRVLPGVFHGIRRARRRAISRTRSGAPEDILVPLNDPRVCGEPRVFRAGIQFEWCRRRCDTDGRNWGDSGGSATCDARGRR